ncbi:hypothetical protein NHX12_012147 [Muraenolepis orangiensis]|uniref:Leukocyte cell-derived chemotaxin 2 n=1 Tax=Muraenolepis orangiensis TaxID=630683 RepID=A0A9Q0DH58_9TELE|nr:hypothetical protein NHX12_012147 [Muraenolepis orangiensis]
MKTTALLSGTVLLGKAERWIDDETMTYYNDGRTHQGLDIVCADGSTVYAPFDVVLNGALTVYGNPSTAQRIINTGINIQGEGLCVKLFYVSPVQTSGLIRKGQKIGTMLPMQRTYPGITSHVHVQMCDKSDPTRYF